MKGSKRSLPLILAVVLLLSLFLALTCSGSIGRPAEEYSSPPGSGTQAKEFWYLSEKRAVERIGSLCREDMESSGILASVTAAQFIMESLYGTSELAQEANNCFGMKCSLSGNTWEGSTWDGVSRYTTETEEEYSEDTATVITAEFRRYPCVEDSIADHSAYLLGAMNGDTKRYEGLAGETDYRRAAEIIKDGGYSTNSEYAELLCSIIEEYELTRFDQTALGDEAA